MLCNSPGNSSTRNLNVCDSQNLKNIDSTPHTDTRARPQNKAQNPSPQNLQNINTAEKPCELSTCRLCHYASLLTVYKLPALNKLRSHWPTCWTSCIHTCVLATVTSKGERVSGMKNKSHSVGMQSKLSQHMPLRTGELRSSLFRFLVHRAHHSCGSRVWR